MNTREFLQTTAQPGKEYPENRNMLYCNDGFYMSVQASRFHYCHPRDNNGTYDSAEISYPSEDEGLIIDYAESPDNLKESVFGYVPLEIIDSVIEKHSGINIMKTFHANI